MQRTFYYGVSLLEMLLVLGIISVIVVMSTRFFSTVRLNQQVTKTIADIKTIRQAAAEWALGQGDYTGISMTVLYNAGLLPQDIGTGIGKTAWGGNYAVSPPDPGHGNPTQLVIALQATSSNIALSREACVALNNQLQNEASVIFPSAVNCATDQLYGFYLTFN